MNGASSTPKLLTTKREGKEQLPWHSEDGPTAGTGILSAGGGDGNLHRTAASRAVDHAVVFLDGCTGGYFASGHGRPWVVVAGVGGPMWNRALGAFVPAIEPPEESMVGLADHAGYQEKIHDPTDDEEAARAGPQDSRADAPAVEAVYTEEAEEEPQYVGQSRRAHTLTCRAPARMIPRSRKPTRSQQSILPCGP